MDRYLLVKGGGLALGGGGPGGAYVGLELGSSARRTVDLGFSLDWFHRRSRDLDVVFETDHGFDPPVRGEITRFESAADFVPLGVTLRLRVPLRNPAVRPFLAGTVGYEVLRLEYFELDPVSRPYDALLGRSAIFHGFGWQAAAGAELALGRDFGLFGEVGMHRGTPSRQGRLDGTPIDLRVDLDGAFFRAGLRMRL